MDRIRVLGIALVVVAFCFVGTGAFADGEWAPNGDNNIYSTNSGNVGIGTDSPAVKLHVLGNTYFRDNEASISSDLEAKNGHTMLVYLNDEQTYGYVKGLEVITELSSGRQVGDASNKKYIEGLVGIQTVRGGELYGSSYGVFGLSYVRNNGIIHGNSVSVYGQGAIAADGHVTGDLIGVYGNVSASGGQVDGKRWAGYFNGNTYINGNLGIGYKNPKAQLVLGNAFGAAISGSSCGRGVFGSNFATYQGGDNHCKFYTPYSHSSYGYSGLVCAWGHLYFYTNSGATNADEVVEPSARMFISKSGNVGIWTTEPDYPLSVNGTIAAKEVKVTTAISANEFKATDAQWSDFVFEDNYKLPSLDHVENYIKENKHLPDIPSAEQIAQDGLSMSEMMTKQMQKIEELTLYVIELNRKNEALQNDNAELKGQVAKMSELEARINAIEGKK